MKKKKRNFTANQCSASPKKVQEVAKYLDETAYPTKNLIKGKGECNSDRGKWTLPRD